MKKSIFAILIVVLAIILLFVAGFFYYKYKNGVEVTESLRAPKLFSKGDYRVETRADGQYIVVDKVGLTAKVPATWRVEFEGNDLPDGTSQYWVNLLSKDAEKTSGLLTKGCGISILIGNNEKGVIADAIFNEEGMEKIKEDKPDFSFDVVVIGTKKALESTSPIRKIFGKTISLNIPTAETLVVLETRIPEVSENVCLSVWDDFVKTVDFQ